MRLNDLQGKSGSNEVVVRKTEVARTESVLSKLNSVYDEHAKLVFLFDVSGSMTERVAADKNGATFADQYRWPASMDAIRAEVVAAVNAFNADPMAALLGGVPDAIKLADPDKDPTTGGVAFTADDEELKRRIIQHGMVTQFGVTVDFSKRHQQPPTRIELVKKLAAQELQNRFKKFPSSRIAVVPFGTQPQVIFDDGPQSALQPELDKLSTGMNGCGGGTDILAAISAGVEVCRKNPSAVGIHHFIVVSDGEDWSAGNTIGSWVPALKASGVVLDYIHIGDSNVNEGLKAACKALGGEFVVVNTEKDFSAKFVEMAQRLCLPPAK